VCARWSRRQRGAGKKLLWVEVKDGASAPPLQDLADVKTRRLPRSHSLGYVAAKHLILQGNFRAQAVPAGVGVGRSLAYATSGRPKRLLAWGRYATGT
jgi:hypothetical protein